MFVCYFDELQTDFSINNYVRGYINLLARKKWVHEYETYAFGRATLLLSACSLSLSFSLSLSLSLSLCTGCAVQEGPWLPSGSISFRLHS